MLNAVIEKIVEKCHMHMLLEEAAAFAFGKVRLFGDLFQSKGLMIGSVDIFQYVFQSSDIGCSSGLWTGDKEKALVK